MGGSENGALLRLAADHEFDALITVDQGVGVDAQALGNGRIGHPDFGSIRTAWQDLKILGYLE